MNKYEEGSFLSDKNRAEKLASEKLFNEFREIVLNNKNYVLGKAREIIEDLSLSEKCHLFERFKKEEGALPDNLTIEYTKLIYSLENIQEKMTMDNSFYEVLSKIAQEAKTLGINPDALVADKMIRDAKKEILEDGAN